MSSIFYYYYSLLLCFFKLRSSWSWQLIIIYYRSVPTSYWNIQYTLLRVFDIILILKRCENDGDILNMIYETKKIIIIMLLMINNILFTLNKLLHNRNLLFLVDFIFIIYDSYNVNFILKIIFIYLIHNIKNKQEIDLYYRVIFN